jgi:hypothetical protein
MCVSGREYKMNKIQIRGKFEESDECTERQNKLILAWITVRDLLLESGDIGYHQFDVLGKRYEYLVDNRDLDFRKADKIWVAFSNLYTKETTDAFMGAMSRLDMEGYQVESLVKGKLDFDNRGRLILPVPGNWRIGEMYLWASDVYEIASVFEGLGDIKWDR